ncbi:MAG: response regulator [Natronomonas sp.]|uniref:response regulator n=1 Tax=Natronomonas sp. TaxID=2184060 RepID=UPI00287098DD|nr:response regulator [Natronomonas sp.]MDR9380281.1 response regulator [Natronomonas sp.]MDR9429576.1 response regulator [Natronomonas sp.]
MTDQTRVLYVDDDSNALAVRAAVLEEFGFGVVTETSVESARRRLVEDDIDCVLCDLDMPDEDGFSLLKHVQEEHPTLPFILFTGHESEDVVEQALDLGAADYFPKSLTTISYRLLAHRIERAVQFVEAKRALAAGTDAQADENGDGVVLTRTEADAVNTGSQDDIDPWKRGAATIAEEEATEPVSSTGVEDVGAKPNKRTADEAEEPAGPATNGEDGVIRDKVRNALRWLDHHTPKTETGTEDPTSTSASKTDEPRTSEPDPERPIHDDELLEGLEIEPGDGVLIECISQDDRNDRACTDLLGLDSVEGRNVLLIRYRQIRPERLRRIAGDAEGVHLISIGYPQSLPDDIDESVETTRINNPSELTRLGIVMTRVIGEWGTDTLQTVVCVDSLEILVGYTDERSVFRFLQVLLSKLRSANAISHFHIEPSRGDSHNADVFKPLFDSVVTIDHDDVYLE